MLAGCLLSTGPNIKIAIKAMATAIDATLSRRRFDDKT